MFIHLAILKLFFLRVWASARRRPQHFLWPRSPHLHSWAFVQNPKIFFFFLWRFHSFARWNVHRGAWRGDGVLRGMADVWDSTLGTSGGTFRWTRQGRLLYFPLPGRFHRAPERSHSRGWGHAVGANMSFTCICLLWFGDNRGQSSVCFSSNT